MIIEDLKQDPKLFTHHAGLHTISISLARESGHFSCVSSAKRDQQLRKYSVFLTEKRFDQEILKGTNANRALLLSETSASQGFPETFGASPVHNGSIPETRDLFPVFTAALCQGGRFLCCHHCVLFSVDTITDHLTRGGGGGTGTASNSVVRSVVSGQCHPPVSWSQDLLKTMHATQV